MSPQIVWKILSYGNWVMMPNGCEKLSDKRWIMSYEWWMMSDGNWVIKKMKPNSPLFTDWQFTVFFFFFLVKNIDNWNCRIWKNMMTQFDRTRWHRLCAWEKVARTLFFKMMRQPTRYYYAKVLIVRDKLSQILNTVKLICQDITWENLCAQILP